MKRNVSLAEISDGRLYGENDMVKADCRGCQGCSACCREVGSSIKLDPFDIYRLTTGLGKSFQELLTAGTIELQVVDGAILPNLAMMGVKEQCAFLNEEGRCSIHSLRPGICRLFPLGRYYEGDDFKYFLQVGECTAPRGKVKVDKWIDTPNLRKNHGFVVEWHGLLHEVEDIVCKEMEPTSGDEESQMGEDLGKQVNMLLLQLFFVTPYEKEMDFYTQFGQRKQTFLSVLQTQKDKGNILPTSQ